tara:strand:+ start:587 stop:1711 length:1125 start_codon:yes stop_codon:yes gene_type:complete
MAMRRRIVIAGGGTGGHLYPGIALARELMERDREIEISFVGTRQGIESRVLPMEGFDLKIIPAGGLVGKRGIERWSSWFKLPFGLADSLCFLLKKRPNLVVGVGGYASGPLALSAGILKIPLLIHEQNSIPGMTNRLLGKIANKVAVSFKQSIDYFPKEKVEVTGNMIRKEFQKVESPELPRGEKFCVLVFGGSQGARSINRAIVDALVHLIDFKARLHFIHQTGEADREEIEESYAVKGFSSEVRPFFFDMAGCYRRASLVICRAGATTLAEVTASGKASVLIPFPQATHNHQAKNAEALVAKNAAEVIYDNELDGKKMADFIKDGLENPAQLEELGRNSYRLGNRDAAKRVADLCVELMKDGNHEFTEQGAL